MALGKAAGMGRREVDSRSATAQWGPSSGSVPLPCPFHQLAKAKPLLPRQSFSPSWGFRVLLESESQYQGAIYIHFKNLVDALTQLSRKEHHYLPGFKLCFSHSVALCLLVSAGLTCEREAANKAPAIVSRSGGSWISCGEEARQVMKTLWKDLFCQLWCGGIHPKHPAPMAPAACCAVRIKPKVSPGLFRMESASLVPKRLVEYFLHPLCRKWSVGEQ